MGDGEQGVSLGCCAPCSPQNRSVPLSDGSRFAACLLRPCSCNGEGNGPCAFNSSFEDGEEGLGDKLHPLSLSV